MFAKVSVFVDSALKRRVEWVPGQCNGPVWQTCFYLISLFVPLAPHGHYQDKDFGKEKPGCRIKDPNGLLRPLLERMHHMGPWFSMTPLAELMSQAHRIEVVISDGCHESYTWTLSYYLKNFKNPGATVTIKLTHMGEIRDVQLDERGLDIFVDFSKLDLHGLTIEEYDRLWHCCWSVDNKIELLRDCTKVTDRTRVARLGNLSNFSWMVTPREMQKIIDELFMAR